MPIMGIDIETYSSVDLAKAGVKPYTESPDFTILLIGYKVDNQSTKIIDLTHTMEHIPSLLPHIPSTLPTGDLGEFMYLLFNRDVLKTAYNASFERICLEQYFDLPLPPEEWRCTMVQAASLGLPGTLAQVGAALGLEKQKMTEGKELIRYFCKPPRHTPADAPDKWELFCRYNIRDVDVETEIRERLSRWPRPQAEIDAWALDQRINDRGVRLDVQLVENALKLDAEYTARLIEEARKLTGLPNPNSDAQLKYWLERRGLKTTSLDKEAIPVLLEQVQDDTIKRVLILRQELGKTSVKKYAAMQRGLCADGRAHNLLQFYGANRTGRWSGRLVQLQNLPQNKLKDLSTARRLVREGDFELLELAYGPPPFVLSQLIRTALIPSDNCRFIIADYSAIEARVLAWLADEQWVLQEFYGDGLIYEATASMMFHVPKNDIRKGGSRADLRSKGKVATLACIAEGSPVLTDRGLIPIEKVSPRDLVWDGCSWVHQDGPIYRGKREVMTYDGLTATPDHLVWVQGECGPIQLEQAARSGARLLQTGDGGEAVRACGDYQLGKKMECKYEQMLCTDAMPRLWGHTMDAAEQSYKRHFAGMPELFSTATHIPSLAVQTRKRSKRSLHKPKMPWLQKVRRTRSHFRFCVPKGNGRMGCAELGYTDAKMRIGSYRQQQRVCSWKPEVGNQNYECREPGNYSFAELGSESMALCAERRYQKAQRRDDTRTNNRGCQNGGEGKTKKLEKHPETVRVYDLLNAGPNHRFTVSGRLVHNCGYQGGVGALVKMGALKSGIPEEELSGIVKRWRQANRNIVQFWYKVEQAAINAVRGHPSTLNHGLHFRCESDFLFIALPSGRRLAYYKPELQQEPKFDKLGLTYLGVGQNKQYCRLKTYGGKLVENITQATARDCLRDAIAALENAGYRIVFHVHDEVIADMPIGTGSLSEMQEIMGRPLPWAPGLPLRAAGFESEFYMKD